LPGFFGWGCRHTERSAERRRIGVRTHCGRITAPILPDGERARLPRAETCGSEAHILRYRFTCRLHGPNAHSGPQAADHGVPQRRVRAFLIGYAHGEVAPDYPQPPGLKAPTVRDAISDLSSVDRNCTDCDLDDYDGPLGQPSEFASVLRRYRNGRVVKRLSGCLRTSHSPPVVARFRATRPGGQESVSRYYRLAWGGICPTLRAGTGPDHGSHTAPRPIHPVRPRCITVREAARLHTFPDWFTFHATKWHSFRQIGNSVPPYLARAVASQFYDILATT
jgi:DNA (cytosine-5)-methyltransferase 1